MATRTVKRAGGANTRKKKTTPKFLLVKDADAEQEAEHDELVQAEAGTSVIDEPDQDWPGRENIRNGLVDQVSSRFGIPRDAATRAINDMLRLD